jgi:hypothetical protein
MSRRSLDDYLREVRFSRLEGGYGSSSALEKECSMHLAVDGKKASIGEHMRDYLVSVVNGWRPPLPPKGRYENSEGGDLVDTVQQAWGADPKQRPAFCLLSLAANSQNLP